MYNAFSKISRLPPRFSYHPIRRITDGAGAIPETSVIKLPDGAGATPETSFLSKIPRSAYIIASMVVTVYLAEKMRVETRINGVQKEMQKGFSELRVEIKDVREKMDQGFKDVRGEIKDIRGEVHPGFDQLKTLFFQEKIKELDGHQDKSNHENRCSIM